MRAHIRTHAHPDTRLYTQLHTHTHARSPKRAHKRTHTRARAQAHTHTNAHTRVRTQAHTVGYLNSVETRPHLEQLIHTMSLMYLLQLKSQVRRGVFSAFPTRCANVRL